jgi:Synergist-CTERM protein sorting domain-containing protein
MEIRAGAGNCTLARVAFSLQDGPIMVQRLAAIAALLLAPTMTFAQATPAVGSVTIVESADPTENPPYINIKECDATTADTLTYYWQVSSFVGGTYDLYIADQPSTSETCPAQSSTTLTVHSAAIVTGLSATAASQNYKDTATISQRLKQLVDAGATSLSCTGTSTTGEFYLCVNYTPTGGTKVVNAASGSPKLDLGKPPTPADVVLGAGDSVLHVSWKAGSGGTGTTDGYRVRWGPHNGALDGSHDLTDSGTTSFDIGGLQNDAEYDVQVLALSPGNNESDPTASAIGKPIFVNDFWRLYRKDGGREQGGCAAGGGGILALLALVPLAWRRHRRRP